MRPIRLELQGFTAYREYTVVDFDGCELFALIGPTGSGKSSLIDAMTFALYGSVPRYANPNLVHPVVSQGKVETKVRFDFAADRRRYTAVRVVRKTPSGGATTKEARLESEGQLLAGSADEVSRKVREVLGLTFEQFTTCVVLPQGEFARFLHEKPSLRQDLLAKLLGVDIYEKMGNLARVREAEATRSAQIREDELVRLRDATEGGKRAAERRVKDLDELKADLEAARPELDTLDEEIRTQRAEAAQYADRTGLLENLAIPGGVAELARKLERAQTALDRARQARAEADEILARAEVARGRLGDPVRLNELSRAHEELASGRAKLVGARRELEKAEAELQGSEARIAASRTGLESARSAVEEARRRLAAHDLASHLEPGKPCPVCGRTIDRTPELALPPALSNAESELRRAEREHQEREKVHREAERNRALANDRLQSLEKGLGELERKLAGAPEASAVDSELEAIARAEAELAEARGALRKAIANERSSLQTLDRLAGEEASAWRCHERARDALAALDPPPTDRASLREAWKTLVDWARGELPSYRDKTKEAKDAAEAAGQRREAKLESFRARCAALGVDVSSDRLRDGVVSALAHATHELDRISKAIDRAAALRSEIERERESARVAGALGQHLKSTGFERWLLEEAFRRLVSGATLILRELSSGQYSFEYDEKLNFQVIDHRNADERRSARTLSGGETFLASLALALTLAEQTAELAAAGSAKLESLFLDEGFGNLDDDTLEVVAAAIEELGARGRMVGLVTHQQNLAEKIPVQYRVAKGPVTATVAKVVA